MPYAVGILGQVLDAHGVALGSCLFGLDTVSMDNRVDQVLEACQAFRVGEPPRRAAKVEFFWCLPDNTSAYWGEVLLDPSNNDLGKPASFKDVEVGPRRSLALVPDYGGAALWDMRGTCDTLVKEDWIMGRSQAEIDVFHKAINEWQTHFEWFVDSSAPELDNEVWAGVDFDWRWFASKAAALALRSRHLVIHSLHCVAPHEMRSESPEGSGRLRCWVPRWEAASGWETKASEALERLDEAEFIQCWRSGARQGVGRPMPWMVYCAHFGLFAAMRVMRATDPAWLDQACAWGCKPFSAAFFAGSVPSIQECLAGAPLPEPYGAPNWLQVLFERANVFPDQAQAIFALLLSAGEAPVALRLTNRDKKKPLGAGASLIMALSLVATERAAIASDLGVVAPGATDVKKRIASL